jgi:hypothetical protein
MAHDEEEYYDLDIDQITQGSEGAKDQSKRPIAFDRVEYLRLEAGPDDIAKGKHEEILRYLTDFKEDKERGVPGFWTVDHHAFTPTKPRPKDLDKDRKWPKSMGACCRRDKAFAKKSGGKCYIHDNVIDPKTDKAPKVSSKVWALACVRNPIVGDGSEELGGEDLKGQVLGYEDATKEVAVTDDDGKVVKNDNGDIVTKTVKRYVWVHQAWSNYFENLTAMGRTYGTCMDRDYLVRRDGTELDTEYYHIPMDPQDVEDDNGKTVRLDLRNGALREEFYGDAPNLLHEIARQGSVQHYNRWFVPDSEQEGSTSAAKKAPASAAKEKEPAADRTAQLRARLVKNRQSASS